MDDRLTAAARGLVSNLARRVERSHRVIKDLPEWAGFGNQLYFFLWASAQRRRGVDVKLVCSERARPWLEHFPLLGSELTIERQEVRLADERDTTSWQDLTAIGHPGMPTREDVASFIDTYLMPSGMFGRREELVRGLTLNVRRGDYFSDPAVRGVFGFDHIAYIDVVLDGLEGRGRVPEEIRVVSDDLQWCRARLQHLETPRTSLHFLESDDPVDDLRSVSCSRELIIVNSSFSIWAAYISNHLYGDNHGLIHVPAFGTRPFDGTPWPSLDQRWDIVPTIPGGWDS